jgi:hypothetical protein
MQLDYKDWLVNAVRGIIVVYCENHTEHINIHCREKAELF